MSRHELFTVSFARDFVFARALVRSIDLFAVGFDAHTIAVPYEDFDLFKTLKSETLPLHIARYQEPPGKGMLQMLIAKHRANKFCPNADYVHIIDSDCIFTRPVTPHWMTRDDKILVFAEPYETYRDKIPSPWFWFAPVKEAIGFDPPWETMQCFPTVYHKDLFDFTIQHVETTVGEEFDSYYLRGKNSFPQDRCEHNTLGNVALRFFPDKYRAFPPVFDRVWQSWSHGGPDFAIHEPACRTAALPAWLFTDGMTSRQIWKGLLDLDI